MSSRNLLRKQLSEAWDKITSEPYKQALINSERGLQVYFCHELLKLLSKYKRRIFIEPTLVFPDGKKCCPDLVICNSQQIIGVIEIKYAPRTTPKFNKDFDTLARVAGITNEVITLSNERYFGSIQQPSYSIANDAVLCWAAIHLIDKPPIIPQDIQDKIGDQYLSLLFPLVL